MEWKVLELGLDHCVTSAYHLIWGLEFLIRLKRFGSISMFGGHNAKCKRLGCNFAIVMVEQEKDN